MRFGLINITITRLFPSLRLFAGTPVRSSRVTLVCSWVNKFDYLARLHLRALLYGRYVIAFCHALALEIAGNLL